MYNDKPFFSSDVEEILNAFEKKVLEYEGTQAGSDEAKDLREAFNAMQKNKPALEKAQNILNNDPTAFAWIFKSYLCIKNKKGYKYPSIQLF